MKKNPAVLGLLMVFLFISCEREGKNELITNSSFGAINNGKKWISTGCGAYYVTNEERFAIAGIKGDSIYYEDEQLFFTFKTADIPPSDTVTDFYAEWNYIVGGDAVSDTYVIDSTYNNWIKIISLDTINLRISGTFKINLVRSKWRSNRGEKKLFQNGYFTMNYTKME